LSIKAPFERKITTISDTTFNSLNLNIFVMVMAMQRFCVQYYKTTGTGGHFVYLGDTISSIFEAEFFHDQDDTLLVC